MNELSFNVQHKYQLHEESRIVTDNSVIYRAQDFLLQKDVCIKEITIGGQTKREIQDNLDRAILEVRKMIQVSSRNSMVPTVYLFCFDEKCQKFYIVMDWIQGETLEKYIDKPNQANEFEFLSWMEDLCFVLSQMSRIHLYHKDIKPANLIVDARRKLHLLDFSISASLPNKVEGTPYYKAPEMENASTVKRDKVDIFSIGVMMYRYYTGILPKQGSEYGQKSIRHAGVDWDLFIQPKKYNPQISDRINAIIVGCMQKDPAKRLSIEELRNQIKSAKGTRNGNRKKEQKRNP